MLYTLTYVHFFLYYYYWLPRSGTVAARAYDYITVTRLFFPIHSLFICFLLCFFFRVSWLSLDLNYAKQCALCTRGISLGGCADKSTESSLRLHYRSIIPQHIWPGLLRSPLPCRALVIKKPHPATTVFVV